MKWYLSLILICISLVANDEHSSCACWSFACHFWKHVCSYSLVFLNWVIFLFKKLIGLFLNFLNWSLFIYLNGLVVFLLVVRVLYKFWLHVPHQIYDFQMFSSILWVVFPLPWQDCQRKKSKQLSKIKTIWEQVYTLYSRGSYPWVGSYSGTASQGILVKRSFWSVRSSNVETGQNWLGLHI